MLISILRYLRGFVDFKIMGKFPERFINLCLKNGVGIFNILPCENELRASLVVSDYRYIRDVARRAGVKLRIIRKHGFPFILRKHRHRYGLLLGSVLALIIIMIMQNFVWSVEINGVQTLSRAEIRDSLRSAGIYEGVFKNSVDIHRIERSIQLEYEKIGWMSVNIIGTRAEIEIKEKDSVPKSEYSDKFFNIFADKDGIVKSINVKRGTAMVKAGSGVSKGQILVAGTYENAFGGTPFVAAEADIVAETCYQSSFYIPKETEIIRPVDFKRRYALGFFGVDIPVTFGKSYGDFSLLNQHYSLKIGREVVPVTLSREQITIFDKTVREITEAEAKTILCEKLALYKLFKFSDVKSYTEIQEFKSEDRGYILTAQHKCIEEIGVKENLVVN